MTKKIFLIALISLLAYAGNLLSLPLLFGVDFLFGSIITLVALRYFGIAVALPVAIIASTYTYFLWGHPYAIIIFSLEIAVVHLLCKKRFSSIAAADGVYWLLIGMPIVFIFYGNLLNLGSTATQLIMFKQAINGIINAIVATHLIHLITILTRRFNHQNGVKLELRDVIFSTLLSLSLFAALTIIIHQNQDSLDSSTNNVLTDLKLQTQAVSKYINLHAADNNDPDQLSNTFRDAANIFAGDTQLALLNSNNEILASTTIFTASSIFSDQGSTQTYPSGLQIWWPERNSMPLMVWWKKALYFYESTDASNQFRILAARPSLEVMNEIQSHQIDSLKILAIVVFIAAFIAFVISRALSLQIISLANTTQNIINKLRDGASLTWPQSSISELHQLSSQSQEMSQHVAESFKEVNLQTDSILQRSIDGIITLDQHGRIESFNHAAEVMFGQSPKNIIGKNISTIFPDFFSGENNQAGRRELSARHRDGRNFPVEISTSEIHLKRGIIFSCIIVDISQRKEAERLKQEFIANVSHELRTPLTSIKGSIGLLASGAMASQPNEAAKLLDITSRNVERLSLLINDLLDFEKLDSGAMSYRLNTIDVWPLLQRAATDNLPFAQNMARELVIEHSADLAVVADADRLLQIITNFISNAVKFSPQGSRVGLGIEQVDNQVKIYVRDQGPGISDPFKDRIFSRFSQADGSDDRPVQKGTGLGLAISKKLAEDMGGSVGFHNNPDKGATFYVTLPLAA
ncbi:MAG: ATP-binding protein [Gammaproteobacteria bacterium]|nr:ATP-binding protein [Gammaproteobacteria bacterium]